MKIKKRVSNSKVEKNNFKKDGNVEMVKVNVNGVVSNSNVNEEGQVVKMSNKEKKFVEEVKSRTAKGSKKQVATIEMIEWATNYIVDNFNSTKINDEVMDSIVVMFKCLEVKEKLKFNKLLSDKLGTDLVEVINKLAQYCLEECEDDFDGMLKDYLEGQFAVNLDAEKPETRWEANYKRDFRWYAVEHFIHIMQDRLPDFQDVDEDSYLLENTRFDEYKMGFKLLSKLDIRDIMYPLMYVNIVYETNNGYSYEEYYFSKIMELCTSFHLDVDIDSNYDYEELISEETDNSVA